MIRLAFVLGAILVIIILSLSSNIMAQDPNDPGEYDTLYFSPGGMHSPTGDTIWIWPGVFPQDVILHLDFWNDNPIAMFVTPFIDNCNGPSCFADLDPSKNNGNGFPQCFEGSRVKDFGTLICKLPYFPPNFYLGGTVFPGDPVPPGRGLLAALTFTVFDTGRICLDSCFWPPANVLTFVAGATGYTPVLKRTTWIISDCQYLCGDPNYDDKTDIVDVVYLANYVFRSGPPPCFEKSGDANCDDVVDIVDITYIVNYLFKHGPAPGYCP
jgi:hypothetical protein